MIRDYRLVSPSLDGVLNDATLSYEGLKRPMELLRFLDGPSSKGKGPEAGQKNGSKDEASAEDEMHQEHFC